MRKSFVVSTVILFFGAFSMQAQQTAKNDIRIVYSDASSIKLGAVLGDALDNLLINTLAGKDYREVDSKEQGMFGIRYTRQLSPKLRVGADVGYLHIERTMQERGNEADRDSYTSKINAFVIMPTGELSYSKSSMIDFYGTASLGVMVLSSKNDIQGEMLKDSDFSFAFQINPLGLRIGRQLGGFVELGFGHKGIVNIGASYRF
ncbi:hypothetical protein [Sinomicrobium sp.]